MSSPAYKRILFKISGEVLAGEKGFGLDLTTVHALASEIKDVKSLGVEIGIVLGGGNIFRGMTGAKGGIDQSAGDHMGMLATVINALALQDALEKQGVFTRVLSAIRMDAVAEPFIRRRAIRHLEKGRVIIMAAGTGNPFFTTDTAATLRATELEANILLKGTKVDGVYDKDPTCHSDAVFYERVTFQQVLTQRLNVMDGTAIAMAREHNLLICVFNIRRTGSLKRIVLGERIGTLVSKE